MRTFQIDFSDIDREAGEDIFSPISRALDFPDWFGGNLDALWIDDKTGELPGRTVFSDLPGVFDAEILEAKPLSDRKLLLCLFLTKKDEQVYAELCVTADDFYPEVTI